MFQDSSNNILRDVGIIAGVVFGSIALIWRISDVFKSYLFTEIEAEVLKLGVNFLVSVENKGVQSKDIEKMFLIITKNDGVSSPLIKKLTSARGCELDIKNTNDLERLEVNKFKTAYFDDEGNGILSLPFFYEENVAIADEKLTCKVFVPIDTFPINTEPYFVRLYLFAKKRWFLHRLHRTNHTSFVMKPNKNSGTI